MNTYEEILEIAYELNQYAEYDNDELSEAVRLIAELSRYMDYVSDKFYKALVEEMRIQLLHYKQNTTIVEDELEWL